MEIVRDIEVNVTDPDGKDIGFLQGVEYWELIIFKHKSYLIIFKYDTDPVDIPITHGSTISDSAGRTFRPVKELAGSHLRTKVLPESFEDWLEGVDSHA